jgi:hypothetical protein
MEKIIINIDIIPFELKNYAINIAISSEKCNVFIGNKKSIRLDLGGCFFIKHLIQNTPQACPDGSTGAHHAKGLL